MASTKQETVTRYRVTVALVQLNRSSPPYIGPGHAEVKQFAIGELLPKWLSDVDRDHLLSLGCIEPVGSAA